MELERGEKATEEKAAIPLLINIKTVATSKRVTAEVSFKASQQSIGYRMQNVSGLKHSLLQSMPSK